MIAHSNKNNRSLFLRSSTVPRGHFSFQFPNGGVNIPMLELKTDESDEIVKVLDVAESVIDLTGTDEDETKQQEVEVVLDLKNNRPIPKHRLQLPHTSISVDAFNWRNPIVTAQVSPTYLRVGAYAFPR